MLGRISLASAHVFSFGCLAGCAVRNVKSYSSGCDVKQCKTGWRVSRDKKKCAVKGCLCPNGKPPSGKACSRDGAKLCISCNPGFKLMKSQCVDCGTLHATRYSSGCKVSACSAGYKVVNDACAGCAIMNS